MGGVNESLAAEGQVTFWHPAHDDGRAIVTYNDTTTGAADPVATNPEFYRLLWENNDVRILEYRDTPGQETTPHDHPNTVLIALTDFQRRLTIGNREQDVALAAGSAQWLPAQTHSGKNVGDTATHTILVEIKHSQQPAPGAEPLGPSA